jgi:hypothetical protein
LIPDDSRIWYDQNTSVHSISMFVYNPPTPAASRGSASEEALLATRGEKRKFAGSVLRALLFGCGGGALLGQTAS